ncbi:MAG: metal ABC transporter permease [Methylacidiphilales bacterium]|nr:metal ABC transporter permease [Candidatus Methylacidiphilales bacterium]MDW8349073.1 metal ABC transporter permease [Verrucomicrobiae bacterium]
MLEIFEHDFMRLALLSMVILGPACALMGVFITLRGMSFFSDAIAHSTITGLALGLLIQDALSTTFPTLLVVLFYSLLMAICMAYLFTHTQLRPDTIIAFSLTGSVALGIILIQYQGKARLLEGMLFGDIYANTPADLLIQAGLLIAILIFVAYYSERFLMLIVQPDMARARQLNVTRLNFLFAVMIAAMITVCLKMLGALLLTAIIVIPATSARFIARSFRHMLLMAALIGLIGGAAGVVLSAALDTSTGATIVLTHIAILFALLAPQICLKAASKS